MTAKSTIISGINTRVGSTNFSAWRIGLTHDLTERRAYWRDTKGQDVSSWSSWTADSLYDAQAIESHFINAKGMKGGTGGDLSARRTVYVYIF
jgi:hypothetical protein